MYTRMDNLFSPSLFDIAVTQHSALSRDNGFYEGGKVQMKRTMNALTVEKKADVRLVLVIRIKITETEWRMNVSVD